MTNLYPPKVVAPLLDLIAKHESRGQYGIVYGGIPAQHRPKALTRMTIEQVLAWQLRLISNKITPSTAAGRYQFIYKTLRDTYARAGLTKLDLFDEANQDRLACELLRRRNFSSFLGGGITTDDMMVNLAKEWASFPVPRAMRGASRNLQRGQSYYAGDGLNKALVGPSEVAATLVKVTQLYAESLNPTPAGVGPTLLDRVMTFLRNLFGGNNK